jgi:2-phospho-L-lactate guanylyltransferase
MTMANDPDALWAIVPAKDFARAKSRMANQLTGDARSELARGMFAHVLTTLRLVPAIAQSLVITDSDDVAHFATTHGARVLRDPEPARDLAHVIDAALRHAQQAGADAALVLMGDLPQVSAEDLRAIVDALRECDVALAPDRRNAHTNALALRLGRAFATRFGHAQSLAEHRAQAQALGLRVNLVTRPGLALDVDDAADLAFSREKPPGCA